jgi:hypothetical protein
VDEQPETAHDDDDPMRTATVVDDVTDQLRGALVAAVQVGRQLLDIIEKVVEDPAVMRTTTQTLSALAESAFDVLRAFGVTDRPAQDRGTEPNLEDIEVH